MRVAGDPDGCAALVRELHRAVSQVAEAGAYPERTLLPAELWNGLAALRWGQLTSRRAVRAARLADQLAAAARSLGDFAEQLADLQVRAARLTSAAEDEGLHLDPAGGIPPVPVQHGPLTMPEALVEQQRALHRAEVRERLLRQVADLRDDEDQAHRRLSQALLDVGALGGIGQRPEPAAQPQREREDAQAPSPWTPKGWDATALLGLVPTRRVSDLSLSGLGPAPRGLAVLRTIPGIGAVSAGIGVVGDVEAGYSLPGALLKQTAVTTASAGAGVGAGAAAPWVAGLLAVGAAPVAVPWLVGAAVAAGVGYGATRAWDAVVKPGPASAPARRPAPARPVLPQVGPWIGPQVGPARRPGDPLPFDPTCGRGPVRTTVS